jgi:hypothetical protein
MVLLKILARVLLVTMLASVLSPAFGWEMHASHDELAHSAQLAVDEYDGHEDGGHGHEHGDPHSLIGHLFSHLPSLPSGFVRLSPSPAAGFDFAAALVHIAPYFPEPPFRPPREGPLQS